MGPNSLYYYFLRVIQNLCYRNKPVMTLLKDSYTVLICFPLPLGKAKQNRALPRLFFLYKKKLLKFTK